MSTSWYADSLDGAAVRSSWACTRNPSPCGTTCILTLAGTMRRTLIVTNDFPPRRGGIQSFVHELALRLDPDELTVYAPKWEGDAAFDAEPAVRGGAAPHLADDRRAERHAAAPPSWRDRGRPRWSSSAPRRRSG